MAGSAQGDAYSDLSIDQAAALGAGSPAANPELPFLRRLQLGYERASAAEDWGANQADWRGKALAEVMDGLKARGVTAIDPRNPANAPGLPGETDVTRDARLYGMLFDQVAKVRATDPGFLADYDGVVDRDSFEALVAERRRAEVERIDSASPGGLGAAGFAGALGRGFRDPLSYIPVGGSAVKGASIGRQILVTGLREGAANVAITAATEPLVRLDAGRIGVERTNEQFLTDLGGAAIVGGAIGGAAAGVRPGIDALVDVVTPLDRKVARAIREAEIPGEVQDSRMDVAVAQAFARAVPPEQRTPEQQAALNAVARDAELKAKSPFVEGPEGDAANGEWLDLAMRTLSGEAAPRPPVRPVAREDVAAGRVDPAQLRNPPRQLLKAKIRRVESSAADDYNERSGATGPYQFVARTWVSLFRRRYPNDKRSFTEIAALRRDPNLNEVLMDDLVAENATALRLAGIEETAGTLYLAHFLGHDRAVRVLQAAGGTPIGRLLPDEYFADNPWMKRDWTADRLSQWAHQKMGATGSQAAGGRLDPVADAAEGGGRVIDDVPDVEIPSGRYDVEAMLGIAGDDRPVLKPELFDGPEAHAAAQAGFELQRDAAEGFAPVRSADELFEPAEHFTALRAYRGKVTAEAMAETLGVTPDQLRRAVQSMQALDRNSPFILGRRTAEGEAPRVMRRPPRPRGGATLLDFLSQRGLKDTGGELRGMDADRWHREKRFRARLVRDDGMELDQALEAAIDEGFFPEFNHLRLGDHGFDELPDVAVLLDAIDGELRGRPRLRIDDHAALEAQLRQPVPEAVDADAAPHISERLADMDVAGEMMALADAHGMRLDDDTLVDAVDAAVHRGLTVEQALDEAVIAAAWRDLDLAAAETGNPFYAIDNEGRRWDDEVNYAQPGEDGGAGLAPGGGGGRPDPVARDAAQDRAFAVQRADDPEAGAFDDPVGAAATLQRESLEHDLVMTLQGGDFVRFLQPGQVSDLRLRWLAEQERALGSRALAIDRIREVELADEAPWLDPDFVLESFRDDPEGLQAHLAEVKEWQDALTATYRLDEDGDEADLQSILNEIEAARNAAAEMRACMKPPKPPKE